MDIYNITDAAFVPFFEKRKNMIKKICFILSQIPNPRLNKRINAMKKYGQVHVICTRRSTSDLYEPQVTDVEYTVLNVDLPPAKHLLRRYLFSRMYQRKAFKKLCSIQPDIIYCASMDSLMVAERFKRISDVGIIYEVADLRESFIDKSINVFTRAINAFIKTKERKLTQNIEILVVTSPKFYTTYYAKFIPKRKVVFIPNSPDEKVFASYSRKIGGTFTVGFIGGIRYMDQMKLLVDAAKKVECDVFFAGGEVVPGSLQELKNYAEDNTRIRFLGKYKYESDIANLYKKADCIFSVYDADNPNVRIALPNKLYEAIVCELPIIVAKNTYLAELVGILGVGVAVDHRNVNDLITAIEKLREDYTFYESLVQNCRKIKNGVSYKKLSELAFRV